MKLLWFNPENDLALAADAVSYTAPAFARKLHTAGATLPLWYGDEGDRVLCHGINAVWYDRMARDFGLTTDVFNRDFSGIDAVVPWGWSVAARNALIDEGVPVGLLPSAGDMQQVRRLSHRRTALTIAHRLREQLAGMRFAGLAHEVILPEDAEAMLNTGEGWFLKMPWSSSGRGVLDSRKVSMAFAQRFAEDSIRRQGSVMMEPAIDKVVDFARLFSCFNGRCEELGTSVFTTDANGAYNGNLLAPEALRLQKAGEFYPLDDILAVSRTLRDIIQEVIAPHYNGILGVDMLVGADGILHPVVEVNLRMTMGYVANRFAEKHLAEGCTGHFSVRAGACDETEYAVEDGRLCRGTLSLIPANRDFSITATID